MPRQLGCGCILSLGRLTYDFSSLLPKPTTGRMVVGGSTMHSLNRRLAPADFQQVSRPRFRHFGKCT